MKLYLMSQDINNDYDTYDSVVVAAESSEDARTIHPRLYVHMTVHMADSVWTLTRNDGTEYATSARDWLAYEDIHLLKVEYLGETNQERGVILASFNAG
jgi:hypothetical protein